MSRGPTTFKKRDVAAAVEAVKTAGCAVSRVEIDKAGKIVIVIGKPEEPDATGAEVNEWDQKVT